MYLVEHRIKCHSRSDRVEIFPFYDCHVGKRNCAEDAIRAQIKEIIKRSRMKNRHVRVLFGGDQLNAINTSDIRRFDFNELPDWFVIGKPEAIRKKLSNMVDQEVTHAVKIFEPVSHLTIGALNGNHEKAMRTRQNLDVHSAFCSRLGITNLTDEAIVRLRMSYFSAEGKRGQTQTAHIYLRHGYGGGRTAGVEPSKLEKMVAEWEVADVCLSGHSHTFCINPPKPVAYLPTGPLPTRIPYRYRFGANPGCWLYSHLQGVGSYESMACYPARPMMTLKIVIWPFWRQQIKGERVARPKIELRDYSIL